MHENHADPSVAGTISDPSTSRLWHERRVLDDAISVRMTPLDPARSTLLFLHGLAGSSSAWEPLVARGLESWNMVLMDLRGHGLSQRQGASAQVALDRMADDVAGVVHELRLSKVTLLAHSFGCMVALACVSRHSGLVTRLVLMSPGYPHQRTRLAKLLNLLIRASQALRPPAVRAGRRLDYRRYASNTDYNPQRMWADIRNTSLRMYAMCIREGLSADVQAMLQQLNMPVLIVHGDRDRVFPLSHAQRMAARLPQATLRIVAGANHVLLFTHVAALRALLKEFLQDHHGPS